MNVTPLRYPGGKSVMTPFFIDLIATNNMNNVIYAEPYAGGAGTAINLLVNNCVDHIFINDANICIYSFWYYLLENGQEFIDKVMNTEITIDEWYIQRNIINTSTTPSFDLAFATFFLSRTNRSGILTAGPIGGNSREKQNNATYKLDCRFNKSDLCERMNKIIALSDRINVSNKDAIDFLSDINDENIIVYLDPPYYVNGKSLYMDYYKNQDHIDLSLFLSNTNNFKWVLSYDNVPEIRKMYNMFDLYEFELNYSAQIVKKGSELLTHSRDIILPDKLTIRRNSKNIYLNKIDHL